MHTCVPATTTSTFRKQMSKLGSSFSKFVVKRGLATDANQLDVFEKAISRENVTKCIERMSHLRLGASLKTIADAKRCASVFVPFCHDHQKRPAVLFTQRSFRLKNHRGQVCFPGGFAEHDDANVIEAAQRELIEEIGVAKDTVTVYGELNPIAFRDFPLHPVLGYLDLNSTAGQVQSLPINHDEVDSVFLVTLEDLVRKELWHKTSYTHGWTTPSFVDGHNPRIWGMTASILYLLLCNLVPKLFHFDSAYLFRGRTQTN